MKQNPNCKHECIFDDKKLNIRRAYKKRRLHKRGFKLQTMCVQGLTLPELIKNGKEILAQLELKCARINDKCHSIA